MSYHQAEQARQEDILNQAASQVLPYVLLGGERDANNVEMLRQRGITHILNLTLSPCPREALEKFNCVHIPLQDNCNQEILPILPKAIDFIGMCACSENNLLVCVCVFVLWLHCVCICSMVISYSM